MRNHYGLPADTELVDSLCQVVVVPSLAPGLQLGKPRQQQSPCVYLELAVVSPSPEDDVSEGLNNDMT